MELAIISTLLVVILLSVWIAFKKSRSTSLTEAPADASLLLKRDLLTAQEKLHKALLDVGALQQQHRVLTSNYAVLQAEKLALKADYEKLFHQKKSSEVRTGFLAESLLPLTEAFPCDPKTLRFLGSPIDYISVCYDTDTITFIEVKSGDSQLNDNQRKVKKMVEEGKVKFVTVRLNEKGIKVR